jgi:hypothetical protein
LIYLIIQTICADVLTIIGVRVGVGVGVGVRVRVGVRVGVRVILMTTSVLAGQDQNAEQKYR